MTATDTITAITPELADCDLAVITTNHCRIFGRLEHRITPKGDDRYSVRVQTRDGHFALFCFTASEAVTVEILPYGEGVWRANIVLPY